MINLISRIISALLCGITITYTTTAILDKKNSNRCTQNIALIALISIITFFSYSIKYNSESILFKILLYAVVFCFIKKTSPYKIIISLITTIILMAVGDIISSVIFVNITTIDRIRGVWFYILLSNLLVNLIVIILINIPQIKNKLNKVINNIDENSKFYSMSLITMSLVVIIYTFYNISRNYNWSEKYIINIIITLSYFVITAIFIRDKLKYINLVDKYDTLFDYFKELEDTIDNLSLVNHEYNNQLAIIKSYVLKENKKEAINYIDNIIKEINIEDYDSIFDLKNIPKGGIKGLLYYKIICAKNKKVNIVLDVSPKVKTSLTNLTLNENKILSKALGIYIDNAIDATLETNKKTINVEIYVINNRIHFVITNYFNPKNVDINKISKKGYTVKGRGHGKGLYLINKLLNKEKWISHENNIINSCYVQKISIEKSQDK